MNTLDEQIPDSSRRGSMNTINQSIIMNKAYKVNSKQHSPRSSFDEESISISKFRSNQKRQLPSIMNFQLGDYFMKQGKQNIEKLNTAQHNNTQSRRQQFNKWLEKSQKQNQFRMSMGMKNFQISREFKVRSQIQSPNMSRLDDYNDRDSEDLNKTNYNMFSNTTPKLAKFNAQKNRAQSINTSMETADFKFTKDNMNQSAMNQTITNFGYSLYTESQNGDINPYKIKKAGPNVHTFKFSHEPSNFQSKANHLLKKIDNAIILQRQQRNHSYASSNTFNHILREQKKMSDGFKEQSIKVKFQKQNPLNLSQQFKLNNSSIQNDELQSLNGSISNQAKKHIEDIKLQVGLIKMKEVDVENEVRYDELPGLGISKQNIINKKRRIEESAIKKQNKNLNKDSLQRSIVQYKPYLYGAQKKLMESDI
eukprot:403339177